MQTRNRNTFTTIHTEGALLPVDLLQRVRANDSALDGLTPESYHLAPGEKINEAVNRSWNRLSGLWGVFQKERRSLRDTDAGTRMTRERWLLPLFQELGFGRLNPSSAVEKDGKSYPISHHWENIPLHLVGCGLALDRRAPGVAGAARVSPHSLLQEYLNQMEDAQWGVVSNGLILRVLRDNAALTRQAYIEFDLESIFDGEIYSDFALLWLVCHQSRFETLEKQSGCMLERWSKSAQERGTRALDDLRRGVEEAIVSLGSGFMLHPLNTGLRGRLKQGDLSAQDYYRQLLRLVYRLIFLFVAEDRDLLLRPDAPVEARQRYLNYYSTARLRSLAERQRGSRHHDRYEALRLIMTLLGSDTGSPELALPALGGFLFDPQSTTDINDVRLDNQNLLSAVRSLAFITEGNTRRAVDYRNLGPEELGSVYESLLELHPLLNTDAGTFQLTSAAGNERKTTGSYYTPSSLIQILLDSALDPVIQDRLKGNQGAPQQEQALLDLKVCDPACGSGHFLIAAAHRIAGRLAQVRTSGDEPSPNETRRALRDVIRHCIYGVDINPMAVELCKVNLWLESLEPGKPLSFLDAHIQCGNSLVGVGPGMDISEIPDEAFNPVFGDDKATASALKKRNKAERAGQMALDIYVIEDKDDLYTWMAQRAQKLDDLPEETAEQVGHKAQNYQDYLASSQYRRRKLEYDLWTAAFFWKMEAQPGAAGILAPTQEMSRRQRMGSSVPPELVRRVEELAERLNFLHWELCFPNVFAVRNPGFDCMVGNPPWEKIQAEEQQFFAIKDPNIANAVGANRKKLIGQLLETNPTLYQEFFQYKRDIELSDGYIKTSKRYPLTGSGKMNTYAIFTEIYTAMISSGGRAGVILPLGIVTDDNNKDFFAEQISSQRLAYVFGFENEEFLFPNVHHAFKFVCITLTGKEAMPSTMEFAYYCRQVRDLADPVRRYQLSYSEVVAMNPNTTTSPIFRVKADAKLNRIIYSRFPVINNERSGENPWNLAIHRMINPTDDSDLFETLENLVACSGELIGNHVWKGSVDFVPVYEAKMIHQMDHRFGTYENQTEAQANQGKLPELNEAQHSNPYFLPLPRYWMEKRLSEEWISQHTKRDWLFVFRDITSSVVINTAIATIIPRTATVDPCRVIYFSDGDKKFPTHLNACLIGSFNCLVFDYLARQKVSGSHLAIFILKQLPILPPSHYSSRDIAFISPRVLELVYTAWDIKPFMRDIWRDSDQELRKIYQAQWKENQLETGGNIWDPPIWASSEVDEIQVPPFRWGDNRRALLRAGLDAYYAALYGLNRKQLRYILDPADLTPRELEDILDPWEEVSDPLDPAGYDARRAASDFPGETFRVLKEKEFKQYGEYRTRRLVLEAWNRLSASGELPEPAICEQRIANGEEFHAVPYTPPPTRNSPLTDEKPAADDSQPMLSDFGLYKCAICGDLVMGYEKGSHELEKHPGKSVEWKKVR